MTSIYGRLATSDRTKNRGVRGEKSGCFASKLMPTEMFSVRHLARYSQLDAARGLGRVARNDRKGKGFRAPGWIEHLALASSGPVPCFGHSVSQSQQT